MHISARTLEQQAATSAGRAELMRNVWQQLDTLTMSAMRDLDAISPNRLTTDIVASVNTMRSELAKAEAFLESAKTNAFTASNIAALGKNLGAIVGSAEILYKLNNPNLSTYDFGETGAGFIGGVIGVGLVGLITASAGWVIGAGIVGALGAKYLWENHVAPMVGWSEQSSPNFWESVFDAMGLRPDIAIDPTTNTHYLTARNHLPRKDPLVLDLDGGGISTTPIDPNAPRLFDTDGDGVRTATGWVGAGEGIVVRDLNGNGTIDSGRELFGDATVLTQGPNAGQTAAHGFAALADLDSNADGQFDATDAAFASVRLWLDANQDAISQPGELHTLAALGVASIEVAGSVHDVDLGGGDPVKLRQCAGYFKNKSMKAPRHVDSGSIGLQNVSHRAPGASPFGKARRLRVRLNTGAQCQFGANIGLSPRPTVFVCY